MNTTYTPWQRESLGELIRQLALLRSIQDAWDAQGEDLYAQRAMESADDYQVALTRRMMQMELLYVEEGQYTATLSWVEPEYRGKKLPGYWFARLGEKA